MLAPVVVWFSYKPLVRLGKDSVSNFELSITVVYIALLALLGLPKVWRAKKDLILNKAVWLVTAFVSVSGISVLWSSGRLRGVLTIGVIGALYVIFLATLASAKKMIKIIPALNKIFIASAVVMSLLSIAQIFAGIWLDSKQVLLCPGCTPTQFGFARPNVFTVEPQFFANLLLLPAIVTLREIFLRRGTKSVVYSSIIILTALFLSLSRGAIFGFGLALVVLFVALRPTLKGLRNVSLTLLAGFMVCLLLRGTAAAMNPKIDTSFAGATSSSVDQLSLGLIDLRGLITDESKPVELKPVEAKSKESKPTKTAPSKTEKVTSKPVAPKATTPKKVLPNYNGYVEESTNVRLKLSKLAFQSWKKSPSRTLVGVGLGGSGATLRNEFPKDVNPREIVQNEFTEILLENGIIGIALFVAIIGGLIYRLKNHKWLWSVIIAFVVQWNFFSGYPNALHIYLIFILLYIYSLTSKELAGTKKS